MSYNLGWHGGIHLEAPVADDARQPVRAIADGTVAYVRQSTARPDGASAEHPLNYRGWTSDGCVVIRHETEIGADAQGNATSVVFYSITMHLHTIRPALAAGRPIYRKDEIGQAGFIDGEPNKIHFEIICDDANLAQLVGRNANDLSVTADGRTDAVYGEMYFCLPAGTPIYGEAPSKNNPIAHRVQANSRRGAASPAQPLTAAHTTGSQLFVGLRYAGGEGPVGNRGDAYITTYQPDGATLDTALEENDAEYNLYKSANDISDAYPASARPAPSAVYELLRFGRVIGPDALVPADVPHWRQIRHPGGIGWVNLNAPDVRKFSDADFPHWKGWKLVDDSADQDSRCDSAEIKAWLDSDNDGKVNPTEALTRLSEDAIAAKLRRTLCKMPAEWEKGTVEKRWGWLKSQTLENPKPFTEDDFNLLKAHIEALAFWEEANLGMESNHWHFEPREFIAHFRMCGWLSVNEMTQCFPRNLKHLTGTQFVSHTFSWANANARSTTWALHFNKANRKYGIDQRQRLVHYFAQVVPETGFLRLMKESDSEDGSYLRRKPYYPYYGRGLIQLTWAENYKKYGEFRGFHKTEFSPATYHKAGWNPDTLLVTSNNNYNAANCADSAGYYIAGYTGMMNKMDEGISVDDVIAVSRCVNGNVATQNINGLDGRLQSAFFIRDVLLDLVTEKSSQLLHFTWRRNSQQEPTGKLNKNGKPIKAFIARVWDIEVSLIKQRPR